MGQLTNVRREEISFNLGHNVLSMNEAIIEEHQQFVDRRAVKFSPKDFEEQRVHELPPKDVGQRDRIVLRLQRVLYRF